MDFYDNIPLLLVTKVSLVSLVDHYGQSDFLQKVIGQSGLLQLVIMVSLPDFSGLLRSY